MVSMRLFVVVNSGCGNVAVCSPQLLVIQLWTAHTGNWGLNTVHRDVEFGPETSPVGDLVSDYVDESWAAQGFLGLPKRLCRTLGIN